VLDDGASVPQSPLVCAYAKDIPESRAPSWQPLPVRDVSDRREKAVGGEQSSDLAPGRGRDVLDADGVAAMGTLVIGGGCPGHGSGTVVAGAENRKGLQVSVVQRIERLVGGDPVTEEQILRFIRARYGAKSLFYLPRHVAVEILQRPSDFIRAAKQYCEPELGI